MTTKTVLTIAILLLTFGFFDAALAQQRTALSSDEQEKLLSRRLAGFAQKPLT